MPPTFALATKEVTKQAEKLIIENHVDLDSVAIKIDYVFAFRDPEGEEPAMKEKGHRIFAKASIVRLKDRAKGMGDGEILLDGDIWKDLSEGVRAAILDHELEHFEVKRETKTGDFIYDDLQRPVLKLRDHDRQFGWFDNVAQRHGGNSIEVMQLRQIFTQASPSYLPHLGSTPGALNDSGDDGATVTIESEGCESVTVPMKTFSRLAAQMQQATE